MPPGTESVHDGSYICDVTRDLGGRVVQWSCVKLSVPGRPTIWIIVGQGPTALAVSAGGGCLDILIILISILSSFSLSLGRLKYYLKRAVKPKTTKQPTTKRQTTKFSSANFQKKIC